MLLCESETNDHGTDPSSDPCVWTLLIPERSNPFWGQKVGQGSSSLGPASRARRSDRGRGTSQGPTSAPDNGRHNGM